MRSLCMYVKHCIALTFVLMITVSANSQILNIDKSDTSNYSPVTKAKFNLSTGLEIDKQRTTLYDATNTAELLATKNHQLYLLSGSYRFTFNGPQDILNAGFIHLRIRHNYKNTFAPEAFTQYQFDNKRGLQPRFVAGANLRYNFWKQDKIDFNAALGLMYEHEEWNYNGVDSQKIPLVPVPIITNAIKINSYVRLDWKAGNASDLAVTVFVQTKPAKFQPRVAPLVQWNVKAGKHVGIAISYSGLYDVAPVVPISKFYYTFSQSILLSW